ARRCESASATAATATTATARQPQSSSASPASTSWSALSTCTFSQWLYCGVLSFRLWSATFYRSGCRRQPSAILWSTRPTTTSSLWQSQHAPAFISATAQLRQFLRG
ncbi:hypothetical protein LTR16_008705, partial [Cryomyces antarcticus]